MENTTTSNKFSFRTWLAARGKDVKETESSKSRLLRLIENSGENTAATTRVRRIYGNDSLVSFDAFKMFFGVDRAVYTVVNSFLVPATMGGETDKQAVVLIGPPGAGKSDFVTRIKSLYRQAAPIPFLKHSRNHDNPLSLFYMVQFVAEQKADAEGLMDDAFTARVTELKAEILTECGLDSLLDFDATGLKKVCADAGVSASIEGLARLDSDSLVTAVVAGLGLPRSTRAAVGNPEPMVQAAVLGQYGFKNKAVKIADYPIEYMRFTDDYSGSNGIVDVAEVQPLNFDIGEWIGTENIGQLGQFSEGDPRSINLNGAFNKGNRGLVILTEGLKNPPEAQRVLLEALQGRRVKLPAPLAGSVFFDGLIIIHSNEGEYDKFIKVRENEPYCDRFFRIWFPYPLEMSQARRVIEKFWSGSEFAKSVEKGGVHVDPDVFDYLARLEVLTRISADQSVPLNVKADAYDGREQRARGMGTKVSVQDLRERASNREGLQGQSPRETNKVMQAVAANVIGRGNTVTSALMRDALREWYKGTVTDEKRLEFLLGVLRNELDEVRRRTLSQAVLASMVEGFQDEAQATWDKYLDNIMAWSTNQSVKSSTGYSKSSPGGDESFMREIESDPDWGVTSAEANKFRAEILAAVNQWIRDNNRTKGVPYTCHTAVQKCLERFVLKKVRTGARLFSSTSARSNEDRAKINAAKARLVEKYGFSDWSADELLREAEENSDFLVER